MTRSSGEVFRLENLARGENVSFGQSGVGSDILSLASDAPPLSELCKSFEIIELVGEIR